MAEHPLSKLGRLLGGVALMQGRLGHQMLGQMLILGSSEVEVAGASVALSATSGEPNIVAQAAIRTAVPALAVHALSNKREKRLNRLANLLAEKERELAQLSPAPTLSAASLKTALVSPAPQPLTPQPLAPQPEPSPMESLAVAEPAPPVETQERMASLEKENLELKSQLGALNTQLAALQKELVAVKQKQKLLLSTKPKSGTPGPKKPGSK